MIRWKAVLVVCGALALVAQGLNWVGWGAWERTAGRLEVDPAGGVELLARPQVAALPSFLWWARRLAGEQISGAPQKPAASALERVGMGQLRWMPTDPSGPKNLAQAAALRGQPEEALRWVEEARRRRPVSPFLARAQALLELRLGRYRTCLELLAEAQGLAPGFARPRVDVLPGDEDWVRLEGLRQRIRLYPRLRDEASLALASELRRLGRLEEAKEVLNALGRSPLAELERARWALEDGNPAEAARRALAQARRPALPRAVKARAWTLAARALSAAGDQPGALDAAEQALHLDPDSPGPYLALASMAERRGDLELALENARRAWGVAPSNVGVLLTVARLASRAGKAADARLAMQRAVEVAPDRPELRARLVALLLDQGRYMQAAMTLSRALDRFPTDRRLLRLAARLQSETTGRS